MPKEILGQQAQDNYLQALDSYNFEELEAAFELVVKALNFYYQRTGVGPHTNLAIFDDGSWTIDDWKVPSNTIIIGHDAASFVDKVGGRNIG